MIRNVALILLYDKDKKLLLQHRDDDSPMLPGYWALFGGGIEKEETPEEAVRRETMEELNYSLKNPKLVIKQNFQIEDYNGVQYVYMEEYDSSQKLI